jgi:ubiquitin C-terminal hydrolase
MKNNIMAKGNNNLLNYPGNSNQINSNNISENQINQMSNRRVYPFSNVKNPIKTLLIKLGETEYLNAILYLIGNIEVLCKYFYIPNQDNNFVSNIEKSPLSFIIHRLFLHFYPLSEDEKTKSYKPEAIKRFLSEINCVYKSQKKRNPNELFSFILDTLHNELKKPPKDELKNPNNVFNKNDVIKTGIKNFQNCDISKISAYFNWFEIKDTKCTQCNQTMYSFHTYHMLELDILNTSKMIKNNNNNLYSDNSITLYDCLSYYQSRKNNLKVYCKSCHKITIVNCGSKIFSNPNIFVFSLNRGLNNGNFDDNLTDISFQLYEQIDLGNFVEQNNKVSKQYELKGIVSISRRLKNYVTFCKSPVDNNWYSYDSENIGPTHINYILQEHDSSKETDYIPCILVYQLVQLSQ